MTARGLGRAAIDADGMKAELIARLSRAVGAPYS